jgi:hypothetical protein
MTAAQCPDPAFHTCNGGFCSVCTDDSRYDNGVRKTLHVALAAPPIDSVMCTAHGDCPNGQRCMVLGGQEFTEGDTCPSGQSCRCYWPDQSRWKFVITHEAGHQIQDGQFGYFNYGYEFACNPGSDCATQGRLDTAPYEADKPLIDPPNIPNLCGCQHVTAANAVHCLQSAETFGGAFVEGWGQFFSTKAWNRATGTFVYYKEFLDDTCLGPQASCSPFTQAGQPTRTKTLPPMPIDILAQKRWRNDHCGSYGGIGSHATELDVARFLWGIHTAPANRVDMTNIYGIFRQSCHPGVNLADPANAGLVCTTNLGLQWPETSVVNQRSLRAGALGWFGGNANEPRFLLVDSKAVTHGITTDTTPSP